MLRIARRHDRITADPAIMHGKPCISVPRPKPSAFHEHRPLEPRRDNIVGAVVVRLVGAVLLEQSDEWAVARRYMPLEVLATFGDAEEAMPAAIAAA